VTNLHLEISAIRRATPDPLVVNDEKPAAVTFTDLAGQRFDLLIAACAPLYIAGAFATHGPIQWLMIVIAAAVTWAAIFHRRPPSAAEVPYSVVFCAVVSIMWGLQAPSMPLLATPGLAIGTVYAALMLPRRFAGITVVVQAAGSGMAQFASGVSGGLLPQALGVVATNVGLGLLLLAIRFSAERRIDEHTRALDEVNARLDELNRTDALTGLANRRQLDETLTRTWSDAREKDRPISVIMVDIDHFKQYNDRYGHRRGDDCLKRVAGALTTAIRDGDVVARYGGEEFSVVLPDAGPEVALAVAERIRAEVTRLGEEHATAPGGLVSVSAGVASALPATAGALPAGAVPAGALPAAARTADELVDQADRGLYEAKRGGRNRIGLPV
jgi:diguanylate cyclase (GGDEF)-like protein